MADWQERQAPISRLRIIIEANDPTVSIIIPTKNNGKTIEECLQSILDLDYPKEKLQVIVVDAFSTDSTDEILKDYPVEIVKTHVNVAAAYNMSFKSATGEIIGFVDGDAKVDKEWLRLLIDNLTEQAIAGAGGMVLTWNKDNPIPRCIGYELSTRYEKMPHDITRICTTNLILRKRVLEEAGGFDETLPTGYDADIGDKIVSKGYRIIFDPKATVYHYHRPTLTAYIKQQLTYAKYDITLYSKRRGLIARDNVTNPWMVVQPFLFLAIFLSWLISFLSAIFSSAFAQEVSYYSFAFGSALLLLALLSYVVSGVTLARKYRDKDAFFIIPVLELTRSIAWTIGGVVGVLKLHRNN